MGDSNPSELILAVQGPEQMRSFPRKWVRAAIAKGDIKRSQLIWSPNHNEWKQLRDLPHLMPTMEIAPLPPPTGPAPAPAPIPKTEPALHKPTAVKISASGAVRVAQPVIKTPTAGLPTVAKVSVPAVAKIPVAVGKTVDVPRPSIAPALAQPTVAAQASTVAQPAAAAQPAPVAQPVVAQAAVAGKTGSVAQPTAVAKPAVSAKPADVAQPAVVAKPAVIAQPAVVGTTGAVAQPTAVAKLAVASKPAAQPGIALPPPAKASPAPVSAGTIVGTDAPKPAPVKSSRPEREYLFPIARALAVCSFLLLAVLVGGNYFFVEAPFAKQLSGNGLSKLSAYATLGGFYQMDVLTIHLAPSPELKREDFAKTLIGLAKSSPRTSLNGQGWIVVSLTPGLSGGYLIQGNDWKDLPAMANQPPVQQKLYILSIIHDYNNVFLLDSPPKLDPSRTELTDRETRAWNLLVSAFVP